MKSPKHSNKSLKRIVRSTDGNPAHPAHPSYHLTRLLIGSLLGGWTLMLVFFILGFIGTVEFTTDIDLAVKWILYGGTTLGVLIGAAFSVIAALLINIVPPLKRSIHPLAIVRSGFLVLIIWMMVMFIPWPTSSLGFAIGPVSAVLAAWIGIRSNPHAVLIPHSTSGRILGTAVGPFISTGLILMMLIPMLNRGFGPPYKADMIITAVDAVDAPMFIQTSRSEGEGSFPRLNDLRERGGYGLVDFNQPEEPEQLWADIFTGVNSESHGIIDSLSTSADLSAITLWEILQRHGYRVGLFQAPPVHPPLENAAFNFAPPNSPGAEMDPGALMLKGIREAGGAPELPDPTAAIFWSCMLARMGVRLDTLTAVGKEYLIEKLLQPSFRLNYARRKLLEFRIESDCAVALMRKSRANVAILRFSSLEPLFLYYWRYSKPAEFGNPPPDVTPSLANDLARVIPDAYIAIEQLMNDLEPFRSPETKTVLVSNYGVKSAPQSNAGQILISPERLIDALGMAGTAGGFMRNNSLMIRSIDGLGSENHQAIADFLNTSQWSVDVRDQNLPQMTNQLFYTSQNPEYIIVNILNHQDLTPDAWVTMGSWSGHLSELLEPGEPQSGVMNGTGLFLIAGPNINENSNAGSIQPQDVTMTLLRAMNADISRELAGRSLDMLFKQPWLNENPPKYVDNYFVQPPPPEPEYTESIMIEEPVQLSVFGPEGVVIGPEYFPLDEPIVSDR